MKMYTTLIELIIGLLMVYFVQQNCHYSKIASHSVIHEQFEVNIWELERWISVIIAKLLALKFCINNSVQNLNLLIITSKPIWVISCNDVT